MAYTYIGSSNGEKKTEGQNLVGDVVAHWQRSRLLRQGSQVRICWTVPIKHSLSVCVEDLLKKPWRIVCVCVWSYLPDFPFISPPPPPSTAVCLSLRQYINFFRLFYNFSCGKKSWGDWFPFLAIGKTGRIQSWSWLLRYMNGLVSTVWLKYMYVYGQNIDF